MTVFEKMTIDLLLGAKAAHDDLRIRTPELAHKYGVEERFVREKLVDLHAQKLIRLSAWDDNAVRDKPFDEWPDSDSFFAIRWDSGYKRVRLLVRGAELLETLSATVELEPPKRAIGFHS